MIRNATLLLDYGGQRFLIDPDFGAKHARRSFTGKSLNPTVDLPMPPEQILQGIETVIVSHLHSDHFDTVAQSVVPKALPLFCQPLGLMTCACGFPLMGSMSNSGVVIPTA